MKIDSLRTLQRLITLCRKTGVEAMEVDGIKFNLGPAPRRQGKQVLPEHDIPEANLKIPQYTPVVKQSVAETVADVIKTDGLTPDELLFYSASGQLAEDSQ